MRGFLIFTNDASFFTSPLSLKEAHLRHWRANKIKKKSGNIVQVEPPSNILFIFSSNSLEAVLSLSLSFVSSLLNLPAPFFFSLPPEPQGLYTWNWNREIGEGCLHFFFSNLLWFCGSFFFPNFTRVDSLFWVPRILFSNFGA